jgi:hypothetical protein
VFQDFWCHIADVAFWALEPKGLKTIHTTGEAQLDGMGDAPLRVNVEYEFDGLKMYWSQTRPEVPDAANRDVGAFFEGTEGTLFCNYDTMEITLNGEKLSDLPDVQIILPRSPGHQRNFINCVKSRGEPESNLTYVRDMTIPMHLGLISWRLGRKLSWDNQKERFINDDAANRLLHYPYRAPWYLPFA